MAVPSVATYSVAALVDAQTSFKLLVDAGGGAGFIRIRDSADGLLAQVPLASPCGTVNGATGRLTLSISGSATASASGTAAYGEICNSAGLVHLALPAQAGVSAQSGKIVINTLTIASGGTVQVLSATIG